MNPFSWIIGLGIFAVGLVIWASIHDSNACAAKGGRIVSQSSIATGISISGDVAIVPVTTSFCISSDGRILE